MKDVGGGCKVPSELMVLETMSSRDRRKTLRVDFLEDTTAKNSGEHTR